MANWEKVIERWRPIVEKMEEHGMDDYAIVEIYRAAENEMCRILNDAQDALKAMENTLKGD